MGKGNRHRGQWKGRDRDRGDDKFAATRSFESKGSKFSRTMGGALGLKEQCSVEHRTVVMSFRQVRERLNAMEVELGKNPDFAKWLKAKKELIEAEKALKNLPEFDSYHKVRNELRSARKAMDEKRPGCDRCREIDSVAGKAHSAPVQPKVEAARSEPQAQPAPIPPQTPATQPQAPSA